MHVEEALPIPRLSTGIKGWCPTGLTPAKLGSPRGMPRRGWAGRLQFRLLKHSEGTETPEHRPEATTNPSDSKESPFIQAPWGGLEG